MQGMIDILSVDVTEHVPLTCGDHIAEVNAHLARSNVVAMRYLSDTHAGRRLWARFSDDFRLVINDGLWAATYPFEAVYRGGGYYVLSLRLSGNCLESVNSNSYPLGALTCSMVHYAEGVNYVFRMMSHEPLVEVCAMFRASFFAEKYNMKTSEVESLLNPPRHRELDPWFNQAKMTPRMEAVARELRSSSPFGKTWRLFAEAKTLEMVSLYLEQLEDRAVESEASRLSTSDLHRLYAARTYLGRYYTQAPRIDELARHVGLNRRKFTEGFRSEFGHTVHEYIQCLRMEQAIALFQRGVADVGCVAEHVGYAHQSNFATAFKQHFGMSPRTFMLARRETRERQKVPNA